MKKLKMFSVIALVMVASVVMVACNNNNNGGDDVLSSQMKARIKQDYVDSGIQPFTTLESVNIHKYFGTFNSSIALVIYGDFMSGAAVSPITEYVAEKEFVYGEELHRIRVWNDGNFFILSEAYEQRLVSQANIQTIYGLYNN